jgi:hypothetical protein
VTGQPYDSNKNPLHNSFVRRIYFRRKRLCKYAYKRVAGWGVKKFYDKTSLMVSNSHLVCSNSAIGRRLQQLVINAQAQQPPLKKLLSEP